MSVNKHISLRTAIENDMEGDHPQNYWLISEKLSAEHRQNFQTTNEPAMRGRARPPASSSGGFLSASQRYGVQDRTNVR